LVRIAGDSILRERILPGEKLDEGLVRTIAVQLENIVGEMEAEWENDPTSDELREGFRLLGHYVDCLRGYGDR
jgi:hypothetical protein